MYDRWPLTLGFPPQIGLSEDPGYCHASIPHAAQRTSNDLQEPTEVTEPEPDSRQLIGLKLYKEMLRLGGRRSADGSEDTE